LNHRKESLADEDKLFLTDDIKIEDSKIEVEQNILKDLSEIEIVNPII
jgi:hypothetical protein